MARRERSEIEHRLCCRLLDTGTCIVELVASARDHSDDCCVSELGMALGQFTLTRLDVDLASPFAGGQPEAVSFLLRVIRLDRSQLSIRVCSGSLQGHRLEDHRDDAGRTVAREEGRHPISADREHRPTRDAKGTVHRAVDGYDIPPRFDCHRAPLDRPSPGRRRQ